MLRKINSYLALAATIFFVIHAALMCLLLGGVIPYLPWYKIAAVLLLILFIGHAVLSMILMFTNSKENNNGKVYWNSNKATLVQRVMSILLLFMTVVHVQNGAKLWIYQVVYIAIASVHIGISLPRALITVGAAESEAAYKKFQKVSIALGIVITVWSAVSYALYTMVGS